MSTTPDLPAVVTANRLPAKPSLPSPLNGALRSAVRTFGGSTAVLDPEWRPPAAEPGVLAMAHDAIADFERYLAPVDDPAWLTARIDALLQHGWLERTSSATLRVIFGDWLNELRRFPQWAIANAAAQLLRTPGRIGLPQMAQACRAEVGDARIELAAWRRLVDPAEQRAAWQRLEERRKFTTGDRK